MELQTAIEILEYHQEWRLGKREDMIHEPKKLTEALDIVLSEVKKFRLGAVVGRSEQFYCDGQENNKDRCETQCLGCAGMQEIYGQ
jgi:hypothetical protein